MATQLTFSWLLLALFGQNLPMFQGLKGLPEHNIVLSGDVRAPVLVNNTDRGIIAYTVRWVNSSGPSYSQIKISFLHMRSGKPPFIPLRSQVPLAQDTQLSDRSGRSPGAPVAVILDAVIFEDGELVGPDATHTFDRVTRRIQAEQDIHKKLLSGKEDKWDQITAASQKNHRFPDVDPEYIRIQKTFAEELLQVRDKSGEDAAIALANKSSNYPMIWRRQ